MQQMSIFSDFSISSYLQKVAPRQHVPHGFRYVCMIECMCVYLIHLLHSHDPCDFGVETLEFSGGDYGYGSFFKWLLIKVI